MAGAERQNFNGPGSAGRESHGWLRGFALASVVSAFALIVLGGVVRVTGSGLGCGGEWPLCSGGLLPPMTMADIIEYSHRLVASAIVGPLILATGAVAWLRYRRNRSVVIPASVAVILLLAQGGLGGVTVLTELPGLVVAAHLALAQALLGCLILTLVSAYRVDEANRQPTAGSVSVYSADPASSHQGPAENPARLNGAYRGFPRLAAWAALATYLLLLSGAYVTATPGALAACPDWPLCRGLSIPAAHLEAIHMLHRVVAAVLGILILYTLYRAFWSGVRNSFSHGTVFIWLSIAGAVLFLMQILVGAIAIWTNFPVELRAYHIALATAVWGIMAALALLSRGRPVDSPAEGRQVFSGGTPVEYVGSSQVPADGQGSGAG